MNKLMMACVAAAAGGLSAGVAAFYAVKAEKQVKELEEKLKTATDKVANGIDVDIPDYMMDEAIRLAVGRSVAMHTKDIAEDIRSKTRSDISSYTSKVVNEEFEKVRGSVKEELERKIGRVSIDSVKSEIIEQAKRAAKEKFEGDLDKVLADYSDNLANVSKIYQSIADSMKPSKDSGIKISLD